MYKNKAELEKQLEDELGKDEFSIDVQKLEEILMELAAYDLPEDHKKTEEVLMRIKDNLKSTIEDELKRIDIIQCTSMRRFH